MRDSKSVRDLKAFVERMKADIDTLREDPSRSDLAELMQASCRPEDVLLEDMDRCLLPGTEPLGDLQLLVAMRAVRALQTALKSATRESLMTSLASATDMGALARIVSAVQFSDETADIDPFAGPIARSIEHRRELKAAAGEMLSSAQVQEMMGVSRQAIDKRRKSGRLLAVMIGSDWSYPAFQFRDGAPDPLMEDVLVTHREADPWVVVDILLCADEALGGRSVLDLVKQRDITAIDRHLAQAEADGFA